MEIENEIKNDWAWEQRSSWGSGGATFIHFGDVIMASIILQSGVHCPATFFFSTQYMFSCRLTGTFEYAALIRTPIFQPLVFRQIPCAQMGV